MTEAEGLAATAQSADSAPASAALVETSVTEAERPNYSYFSQANAATAPEAVTEMPQVAPSGDVEKGNVPSDPTEAEQQGDRPAREKRSRDRYGRDRRDRNGAPRGRSQDGAEQTADSVAVNDASTGIASPDMAQPAPMAAPVLPVFEEQKQATTVTQPQKIAATVDVKKDAAHSLPKVQSYALPMDSLTNLAQSAGLEWVNSDANKVAVAQAGIAAAPKPVHVPREKPPVVVTDEGPLVLVETRRDLNAMALPFDEPATT
jgi:ribonuclease E